MPTLTQIQLQDITAFQYNQAAMRYQGPNGQFVSQDAIRAALQQVMDAVSEEMRIATLALLGGDYNLIEWEQIMAASIKNLHLIGAAINAGGWAQLTDADMQYVQDTIAEQLDLLTTFATQIETGQQPLNGTVVQRSNMYKNGGKTKEAKVGEAHAIAAGLVMYRNVLGPAEHCKGCLAATAEGWQPIGSLPDIGTRDCLTNCHCHFEYGSSEDVNANTDS